MHTKWDSPIARPHPTVNKGNFFFFFKKYLFAEDTFVSINGFIYRPQNRWWPILSWLLPTYVVPSPTYPSSVDLQKFSAVIGSTGRAHFKYWEIHSISNFQFHPTGFMHTDIFPHFKDINNEETGWHLIYYTYNLCIYNENQTPWFCF